MDKILFSRRLKEQIEAKYKTQTAFAIAYDKKYNPGTFCNEANSPHKGTINTIKKYVSPTSPTIPSLDKIDNMCQMLDCDIDYLLGYIDYPKHIHQAMNQECGLSQKATDHLIYWNRRHVNYSGMLNIFLESANFDHALYHAIRLMKVKPILDGLREARREWVHKAFSGPPDCGTAYNYTGDNGLADAISEKEKEYASQRLYLDEYFTFLIQEIERISLEKSGRVKSTKEE